MIITTKEANAKGHYSFRPFRDQRSSLDFAKVSAHIVEPICF